MRVTTLIENNQDENGMLINEHGLSYFIESKYGNILYDTGKSGDFIENAKKLNIDLSSIKTLILSHAHYDHCGGVRRLFYEYDINPEIIIGNDFFKNSNRYHYSDGRIKADFATEVGYKYVGIDFDYEYLKNKNLEIKYVKENMYKINNEVFVFTNFKKIFDFEKENKDMQIKISEDKYIVDPFTDEISVGIKTNEGIVILLGCAHPGFLNITESISEYSNEKIIGIVGGTHLVEADEDRINKSVKYINERNIKILGLSHCTGEKAMKIFNEKCKGSYLNRTGSVLNL